jgi:hypothetical protein
MTQAAQPRTATPLQHGLHLIHYAEKGDQPPRLIAARRQSVPSPTELRVVRDALLAAIDRHPYDVLNDIDPEWQETNQNDWRGYAITWRTLPAAAAFSHNEELRHRVRLALEQREARERQRRDQQRGQKSRPAANPGPKPML